MEDQAEKSSAVYRRNARTHPRMGNHRQSIAVLTCVFAEYIRVCTCTCVIILIIITPHRAMIMTDTEVIAVTSGAW